jgi:hypothetical protein
MKRVDCLIWIAPAGDVLLALPGDRFIVTTLESISDLSE